MFNISEAKCAHQLLTATLQFKRILQHQQKEDAQGLWQTYGEASEVGKSKLEFCLRLLLVGTKGEGLSTLLYYSYLFDIAQEL